MKVQQQKCDMKTYKVDITKTKTNRVLVLFYCSTSYLVEECNNDIMKNSEKDLVKRYEQKDISCHIDNYTRLQQSILEKKKIVQIFNEELMEITQVYGTC